MAHTVMGTGVLALPHAVAQAGMVWGLTFLVIGAILGTFSLFILGQTAIRLDAPSFTGMGDMVKPGLSVLVEIFVILNCLGSAIGYIVVASTSLVAVVGGSRQVWVAVAVALATPLALLRRMDSLRATSLLGIIVLLAFTVVVFVAYFAPADVISPCNKAHEFSCRGNIIAYGNPLPVISSFVTFTNAFVCQQSMLPMLSEMERPSAKKLMLMIVCSMLLVIPVYLVFSIFGYLQFGSSVKSDILDTYPVNTLFSTFRVLMGLAVITSFPMQAFATRKAVASIYRTIRSKCCSKLKATEQTDAKENAAKDNTVSVTCRARFMALFINDPLEFVVALLILAISLGVAMATSDLGIVVGITGATGAAGITFLFPGLFYVFLLREDGWTLVRIGSAAMLLFGAIIIPLALTVIAMGY